MLRQLLTFVAISSLALGCSENQSPVPSEKAAPSDKVATPIERPEAAATPTPTDAPAEPDASSVDDTGPATESGKRKTNLLLVLGTRGTNQENRRISYMATRLFEELQASSHTQLTLFPRTRKEAREAKRAKRITALPMEDDEAKQQPQRKKAAG